MRPITTRVFRPLVKFSQGLPICHKDFDVIGRFSIFQFVRYQPPDSLWSVGIRRIPDPQMLRNLKRPPLSFHRCPGIRQIGPLN